MKAGDLIAKALQAAASAKVLLDTGDADGACNRVYYAMFDGVA
ncbi:MAG: HEPN domain-containing protein [Nitrosospira sp.]|nr:HEPN domain-containing protein [Nitrosospira sp.]